MLGRDKGQPATGKFNTSIFSFPRDVDPVMSSPSSWIHEPETGKWYINWTDEYGKTIRRYSDELDQGVTSQSQASQQYDTIPRSELPQQRGTSAYVVNVGGSSKSSASRSYRDSDSLANTYSETHQGQRQSQPASTYNRQPKRYHDSGGYGGYGEVQGGVSTQRLASYGSPADAGYQLSPSGYKTQQVPQTTGSPDTASPTYIASKMNTLSMDSPKQDTQYTIAPSSMGNTTGGLARGASQYGTVISQAPGDMTTAQEGPGYSAAPSQAIDKRHIVGTPGNKEKLDPRYQVRNHDYKRFFRPGRVFSTLWTDPSSGKTNRNQTFISSVMFGEEVHTKIRRFVVVRQKDKRCICLPVTSYEGRGHKKTGIDLDEHGQIYSLKRPKEVGTIAKKPLRVILSKNADILKDTSLINYGSIYTVESNVKVMDVGVLDDDSQKLLQRYYHKVNFRPEEYADDQALDNLPKSKEEDLAGVGMGFTNPSQIYGSSDRAGSIGMSSTTAHATSPGHDRSTSYSSQTSSRGSYNGYNAQSQASGGYHAPPVYSSQQAPVQSSMINQTGYMTSAAPDMRYTASSQSPTDSRFNAYKAGNPPPSTAYSAVNPSNSDSRYSITNNTSAYSGGSGQNSGNSSSTAYPSHPRNELPSTLSAGKAPATESWERGQQQPLPTDSRYSSSSQIDTNDPNYATPRSVPDSKQWKATANDPRLSSTTNLPSSQSPQRESGYDHDTGEEDEIDLPTREEVQASRGSRVRRESVSRPSRPHIGREKDRERHHGKKR